jgi:serine/threonine protein kinase
MNEIVGTHNKGFSDDLAISEGEFKKRFDFDTRQVVGEGGFAKVYKAYDKRLDEYVALKFQYVDNINKYDIIQEVKTSRKLNHKNIIRVHDVSLLKTSSSLGQKYIQVGVLEFAELGNLYDFIKTQPSEEEFREIVRGVLDGLQFLHSEKNLIHRDLSLDNILIFKEDGKIVPKLADFGISKALAPGRGEQKKSTQLVGKVEYMAPEQFSAKKFGIDGKLSTNVDLWSFGVIIYELFMKKTPFARAVDDNPMSIMHSICNDPSPADVEEIPEPYCTIVKSCLVKNAAIRVQSADQLKAVFDNYSEPGKKRLIPYALVGLVAAAGLIAAIYIISNPAEDIQNPPPQTQPEAVVANRPTAFEQALSEFGDVSKSYNDRRGMIDQIIDRYFVNEEVQVIILVDDIATERKGIREFLLYVLSKDYQGIVIESSEENADGKIQNLDVSIIE